MASNNSTTGVMFNTDRMSSGFLKQFALVLESSGVVTLWLPELVGREPFATAGFLLAETEHLTVATGIANVYARDAVAAAAEGVQLGGAAGMFWPRALEHATGRTAAEIVARPASTPPRSRRPWCPCLCPRPVLRVRD